MSPPDPVLLVGHPRRQGTEHAARRVVDRLRSAGVDVHVLDEDPPDLDGVARIGADDVAALSPQMVLVLGGDGTLLRAAEIARPTAAPLLGVNFGRVGFLAEAEGADLDEVLDAVLEGRWTVEDRVTVEAVVRDGDGRETDRGWALNEAVLEKGDRERVLDLLVEVDGRPVSRFGCDGVLCATPTGSTAYAFSAGGPVVWPQVRALLVVPVSAHALFARPLVVDPESVVALEVDGGGIDAFLSCDGRRAVEVPAGSRVEVRQGDTDVRVVRLVGSCFSDRLVARFRLPVQGWRGPAA